MKFLRNTLVLMVSFVLIGCLFVCCDSKEDEPTFVDPDKSEDVQDSPDDSERLKTEDHCDLVFGFAFSRDLLRFIEPVITVYIEGMDPFEVPVNEENMISASEILKYDKIDITIKPSDLMYCWKGILVEGLHAKGYMTVELKEIYSDYSQFENEKDVDLRAHSFYNGIAVPKNTLVIGSHSQTFTDLDLTFESISIEEKVKSIMNQYKKLIEFEVLNWYESYANQN